MFLIPKLQECSQVSALKALDLLADVLGHVASCSLLKEECKRIPCVRTPAEMPVWGGLHVTDNTEEFGIAWECDQLLESF